MPTDQRASAVPQQPSDAGSSNNNNNWSAPNDNNTDLVRSGRGVGNGNGAQSSNINNDHINKQTELLLPPTGPDSSPSLLASCSQTPSSCSLSTSVLEPSAPSNAANHSDDCSLRSANHSQTELTPLLEQFTRKFAEQVSVARAENVCQTQSQHVPRGLLRVYQQQCPFNPAFDAESSGSFSSSTISRTSSVGPEYFQANTSHVSSSPTIMKRKKSSKIAWFSSNLLFFVSMLAFGVGMLATPTFYSKLMHSFAPNTTDDSSLTVEHLLIIAAIQVAVMSIAFSVGLILLYAGSKLSSALRRKNQQFCHSRALSPETPWFAVTYERIVAATLGDLWSKALAVILIVHLFGLSTLIIVFMSDLMDVFFSAILVDGIAEKFCNDHLWFLSHEVVLSIWLLIVCAFLLLGCSFYKHNRHRRLLTMLKRLITGLGVLSTATLITLICLILYGYESGTVLLNTSGQTRTNQISQEVGDRICLDPGRDWSCFEQRWLLLVCAIPLLLLPFHLNEFLITFMFASKSEENSPPEATYVSPGQLVNSHESYAYNQARAALSNNVSSNNLSMDSGTQSDEGVTFPAHYPALLDDSNVVYYQAMHRQLPLPQIYLPASYQAPAQPPKRHQRGAQDNFYLAAPENASDETPILAVIGNSPVPPASGPSHRSFTSLRNVFFWSLIVVLVLNLGACTSLYIMQSKPNKQIIIPIFSPPVGKDNTSQQSNLRVKEDNNYFGRHSVYEPSSKYISAKIKSKYESHETSTTIKPILIREKTSRDASSMSFEINFLRFFLKELHFSPSNSADDSVQHTNLRTLLIITCGLFLVKCTFVYLLMAVRGLISYEIAFDDRPASSGFCLRSFLFIAPFILWNLLTLLMSLVLDHYLKMVQLAFLLVCWTGLFLMFVFPALVLFYLSVDSLRRARNPFLSTTKPLSWPKCCLAAATVLLCIGLALIVIWPYAYWAQGIGSDTVLSPVSLMAHNDTRSIYCDL